MRNNQDSFNKNDLKNLFKVIILSVFAVSIATTVMIYRLHNNSDLILEKIKDSPFVKINSKIDEVKLKELLDKNPDPFKEIFDPKISFFTKTNSLGIFIEYNLFTKQCELTSRVMGVWAYLDLLNKNQIPLNINIKTYKIKDDYCNQLYGYGKL